jgi:ribosome biogenesis GTPase / thiamine phosphate phosphatase
MSFSNEFLLRARVCETAQEHYVLRLDNGDECDAVPAGALRWGGELPVVGDWVRARRADPSLMLIEEVEERVSVISRQRPGAGGEQVLAANVDLIVVVMGLDGDYNLRRLERYLVLAAASGARVAVVLNKRDVCDEWRSRVDAVRALGVENVLAIEARSAVGELVGLVAGGTTVLLGSSGAGKSTITNGLLGEERQATRAVREGDSRGRHTTTGRMLVELPGGGALIDTPGLRELALWAGQDAVEEVFADVGELARECRYRDCTHSGEPGCAVGMAIADGRIEAGRWASYLKLRSEAAYHERDELETKRKWKVIHKAMRGHPKYNR